MLCSNFRSKPCAFFNRNLEVKQLNITVYIAESSLCWVLPKIAVFSIQEYRTTMGVAQIDIFFTKYRQMIVGMKNRTLRNSDHFDSSIVNKNISIELLTKQWPASHISSHYERFSLYALLKALSTKVLYLMRSGLLDTTFGCSNFWQNSLAETLSFYVKNEIKC